ncbi:MAG: hypothetical protein WC749_07275 [Dehalococcoidia bacterium]
MDAIRNTPPLVAPDSSNFSQFWHSDQYHASTDPTIDLYKLDVSPKKVIRSNQAWPNREYQASTKPLVNLVYLKHILPEKMSAEHVAELRATSTQLSADQDPATHEFEA